MDLSAPPDIIFLEFGEIRKQLISPVWPFRVFINSPVSISHTFMVSSELPETMNLEFGHIYTHLI